MPEPIALPDGNIFMVSDRLILGDHWEIVSAAGVMLGREGAELQVHLTFGGRLNKSTDRQDFTVALPPRDAFRIAEAILHNLGLITGAVPEGTYLDPALNDDGTLQLPCGTVWEGIETWRTEHKPGCATCRGNFG